jgi:hypothetical protein
MNQRMFLAIHEASHLVDGAVHGARFRRAIIAFPGMNATGLVDFGDRPEPEKVRGVVADKPWQQPSESSLPNNVVWEPVLPDGPLKPMLQRSLAGMEGERIYAQRQGCYTPELEARIVQGGDDDEANIRQLLARHGKEAEYDSLVHEAQSQVRLDLEQHWNVVERFADLLMERSQFLWEELEPEDQQLILSILAQATEQ